MAEEDPSGCSQWGINGREKTMVNIFLPQHVLVSQRLISINIWFPSVSDPHIKVAGKYDAVADAKNKIMAVLDTKVSITCH